MKSETIVELFGWIGVVFYVFAYLLLSIGKLKPDGYLFHTLNMLGATGLITDAGYYGDQPNLAVNVIWFAIGAFSILRRLLKSKNQNVNLG